MYGHEDVMYKDSKATSLSTPAHGSPCQDCGGDAHWWDLVPVPPPYVSSVFDGLSMTIYFAMKKPIVDDAGRSSMHLEETLISGVDHTITDATVTIGRYTEKKLAPRYKAIRASSSRR